MVSSTPSLELPLSTSPTLQLLNPTHEEKEATWQLNGVAWRGALPLDAYLRREHHLAVQPLTRNGGITYWVLVNTNKELDPSENHPSKEGSRTPRTILSSCETLRKRALVACRPSGSGKASVQDIVAHGVGSVFCNPAYRGRGYAGRMMLELGKNLEVWQQEEGCKAHFTVLYSDIGKEFYTKRGWRAKESRHVALPAVGGEENGEGEDHGLKVKELRADDLKSLCELDEQWLREKIGKFGKEGPDTRVALIPDVVTMQWHHSREEFAAKEVLGRWPDVKGALVDMRNAKKVWAIWTRTFGAKESGNTLHILRLVVEGEDEFGVEEHVNGTEINGDAPLTDEVRGATAILKAAQREAGRWGMRSVQVWNPSQLIVKAAQSILHETKIVERDAESITSLMWYGSGEVEWVGNEKYGWC